MNDTPDVPDTDSPPIELLGRRERKKQASRLAMHRAALELVAAEGLAAVTAERIAQRADVSTRTFFNHWSTKEAAILGIHSEEREAVIEGLRAALAQGVPARDALRSVLRTALEAIPSDPELRALKKQVMERESRLHSISVGNLAEMQSGMVEVLEESLEGPDAADRSALAVQLGFAVTRAAFAHSMRTGIDLVAAYDRMLTLYDGDETPY